MPKFGLVESVSPVHAEVIAEDLGKFEFKLYPQLWEDPSLACATGIDWQILDWNDGTPAKLPTEPGVYVFIVRGREDIISYHSYLFYIGKAEGGLQSRLKSYLQEEKGEDVDKDRGKIVKLLNYFKSRVSVLYTECKKDEVPQLESALKDNFTPWANTILKLKGRLSS